MVSAVRLSRQAVGCRSAGRQRWWRRRRRRWRNTRGPGIRGWNGDGGGSDAERREGPLEGRRPLGWQRGWEGSDVLPVSIIIGGWLTGRRFAPHNSRRPIILPRLPCTNSYITCRHVLPRLYIITCGAILSRTFFQTIADCGAPRSRGFKIMLVKITIICEPAPTPVPFRLMADALSTRLFFLTVPPVRDALSRLVPRFRETAEGFQWVRCLSIMGKINGRCWRGSVCRRFYVGNNLHRDFVSSDLS